MFLLFRLRPSVDSANDGDSVRGLRKEGVTEQSCRRIRGEWTREMYHSRLAVLRIHWRLLVVFKEILFIGFLL